MTARPKHDMQFPHNILGDGTITLCPDECPAHVRWKASSDV